jgi:ribosomal protein S27E
MKLISCDNCAAILDHDKLCFAEDIYTEGGEVDKDLAEYDQDRGGFFAYVKCPVCGSHIFKE